MSLKEIKDAMEKEKVLFGIRQALKLGKGKKKLKIFVVNDAREETICRLEKAKVKFEVLGRAGKGDVAKELGLDFESEVFTIK
ncbi:hypothetical protein CMI37_18475 [Candidatus Pacearchaeota archaeon]|nr:hypothetical protein [Candidatus Pacearchaeota archaeon]|tara:strand:- start:3392 stop:3640 length:249 start_codon:yes stop_codon:yes gene_type:complete